MCGLVLNRWADDDFADLDLGRLFDRECDDEHAEPGARAYRRRAHILLSAMWGVGLLIEAGVRLAVISRVSVDVANGVLSAVSWGTVGLLIGRPSWWGGSSRRAGNKGELAKVERIRLNFGGLDA